MEISRKFNNHDYTVVIHVPEKYIQDAIKLLKSYLVSSKLEFIAVKDNYILDSYSIQAIEITDSQIQICNALLWGFFQAKSGRI